MKREFPLAPLPRAAWLLLAGLAAATAVLAVYSHSRAPAASWPGAPIFVILLHAGLLWALKRRRITVEGGELVVAATFYTRRVPVQSLALAKARIVDLAEHTELKPWLKTNGFGLPGFRAGHYRLHGNIKAFCLLTDDERVLALPRHDGSYLLLSPEKPQALLARLRELAGDDARR